MEQFEAISHTNEFLKGGGKMGEQIRTTDWSTTPIGSPENWPLNLKLAVSIMLSTPFPMYIAWGKEYTQLYNDGYRPILGSSKHPQALGIGTEVTFKEIWHIIGPMFDGVMKGEAVGFPNFMLPLNRNGYVEECYFDFSYSPIKSEHGLIGGVLVTVIETTEKIKALNNLRESQLELELSKIEVQNERDRLKSFFMQAPAGICILTGPDFVFELINPTYQQLLPERDLLGKPVFEALPEIFDQPVGKILRDVYLSGRAYEAHEMPVSVSKTINGPLVERYFDFIYQPRLDRMGAVDGIMVFVYEVTEAVTIREKLKESSENFQLLADHMSQLAWMADESGALFWYNQQWYDFTGTTFEEMQGWGWEKVQHPDYFQSVKDKWIKVIALGEVWEDTFPLRSKAGEYRWFLSRAVPIKDEKGKAIRWLGTNTDITAQRVVDQQKDDFISIASHELKTPITSLKASLQLLERIKDKPESPILPKLVSQSSRSMQRITTLIEDLLSVTKINQGQLHLSKSWFNVSGLLQRCCDEIMLVTQTEIVVKGDTKVDVCADEHQIEQVVTNFINNALKYAPETKTIFLNIDKINDHVKISVIDKGPGIPKESIKHLFDRYYRAGQTKGNTTGLGLGLFICAEIIRRHRGEIGVESELGKGSTFWFTLPLNNK